MVGDKKRWVYHLRDIRERGNIDRLKYIKLLQFGNGRPVGFVEDSMNEAMLIKILKDSKLFAGSLEIKFSVPAAPLHRQQ